MSSSEIMLSICIPTYNRARYLRVLLADLFSELKVIPFACEIVICDNASSDDTKEVVSEWTEKLPINFVVQKENIGAARNLMDAFSRAQGLFSMYIADDDFIDSNGLINAVNYFLDRPKAVVLYAPWKLIQYQNKATSNQFYEIPEDRVFQKGDYQGLLITILEQHAFPEICLFRTATYRLLLPSENAISYWAFTIPAEWISVGEVIFKKEPFYCASTSYFRDETTTRQQSGNLEVETYWDRYRGGLEHLLGRAETSLGKESRKILTAAINEFIADRMLVALRIRIANKRNPVESYYLAARLKGLGKIEFLPQNYDRIRVAAAQHFITHDAILLKDKVAIVLVGDFEHSVVSDMQSNSTLPLHYEATYTRGHANSVLIFSRNLSDHDIELEEEWKSKNTVLSEEILLTKFS